jgi:hypothetical protein
VNKIQESIVNFLIKVSSMQYDARNQDSNVSDINIAKYIGQAHNNKSMVKMPSK